MGRPVETPLSPPPSGEASAAAFLAPARSLALDQWRGLALLLLLVSHGFFHTHQVQGLGRVGVNLFFFVSGILVFRSLAARDGTAPGRALSFWKRRARRLLPALGVYLAAMVPVVYLLQHGPGLEEYGQSLPYVFALAADYQPDLPYSLHHLWSLTCEAQFYLAAPLVFALGGAGNLRRGLVWGGLLAVFLALGATPFFLGDLREDHFEVAVWPLFLGFACEAFHARFPALPTRLARGAVAAGIAALLLAVILMGCGAQARYLAIVSGTVILAPAFLCYREGLPLGGRPGALLAWLGKRTYSIYLWQEPLTLCNYLAPGWRPLGALLSIGIGALSYRWLERPFLSRSRLRPIARHQSAAASSPPACPDCPAAP